MYRNVAVLVFLGVSLVLAGCRIDQHQKSTPTFQAIMEAVIGPNIRWSSITSEKYHFTDSGYLTSGEITYDASGACAGNNRRVLFIYSGKCHRDDKMKEIQLRLNKIMNGSKYDVVTIQTVYISGRLLAAEVCYRSK